MPFGLIMIAMVMMMGSFVVMVGRRCMMARGGEVMLRCRVLRFH
jgi:hypothetical protein